MDLSNVLNSLASNDTANVLSKKLNIDTSKVSSVINSALPTLIQGMQKNSQSAEGAESLSKALRDHAGKTASVQNADTTDGSKILGKIFGNNTSSVFSDIAGKTGTSSSVVSSILASIAPSVLSSLGQAQQGGNVSAGGLGSMLGSILSSGNFGSVISSAMADKDGDGTPDILGSLGGLFGGKK